MTLREIGCGGLEGGAGPVCVTIRRATVGQERSSNVVHLAGRMLAAGYRSVVASMWLIEDQSGPIVANIFLQRTYGEFKGFGNLGNDSRRTAYAFHNALKSVRDTR